MGRLTAVHIDGNHGCEENIKNTSKHTKTHTQEILIKNILFTAKPNIIDGGKFEG